MLDGRSVLQGYSCYFPSGKVIGEFIIYLCCIKNFKNIDEGSGIFFVKSTFVSKGLLELEAFRNRDVLYVDAMAEMLCTSM